MFRGMSLLARAVDASWVAAYSSLVDQRGLSM